MNDFNGRLLVIFLSESNDFIYMIRIDEGGILGTISLKNQITVPAEVKLVLGLHPRDKVAFVIKRGRVELRPARSTNLGVFFDSVAVNQISDNLNLSPKYKIEYQIQKVIKKVIS